MQRIWWRKLDSAGKFPDGRIKVDVIFRDSTGREFIWTARWEELRELHLEASRVEKMNMPKGKEVGLFEKQAEETLLELKGKPKLNFKLLGIRLGEALKGYPVNQIGKVATAVFDFDCVPHSHPNITSVRAQTVYDWVMTLAERPTNEDEKLSLLQEFVNNLDPSIKLDFLT